MDLSDLLPKGAIDALASRLEIPAEEAQRGAEALLPALVSGMASHSDQTQAHIDALGGPDLAHNVVGPEPTQVDKGNQLLSGIFGSKDGSRQVAGKAAQETGLDPGLLKRMLPMLAMLLAGHLVGRAGAQQGGLGGIIGAVLGGVGGPSDGDEPGGSLGGMLGSILGTRK